MSRATRITGNWGSGKATVLHYKASPHPGLRKHTQLSDLPSTVEVALILARRLHGAAAAPVTHSERTIP
jgi:hypothetical protein